MGGWAVGDSHTCTHTPMQRSRVQRGDPVREAGAVENAVAAGVAAWGVWGSSSVCGSAAAQQLGCAPWR